MALAIPVLFGVMGCLGRVFILGYQWTLPQLKHTWLVIIAFCVQFFTLKCFMTRASFGTQTVVWLVMTTHFALLVYTMINRQQTCFWLIGLGIGLNLLVMLSNGGLMPISPEVVQELLMGDISKWSVGSRLGYGKDIVLEIKNTRLWLLSDRFVTPPSMSYRVAFSLGDALMGLGGIGFLWAGGKRPQ